jgi:hypothetical protein
MPGKVKNIENEVAALRKDISLLTSTLKQLFCSEIEGAINSPKGWGGKEYVS